MIAKTMASQAETDSLDRFGLIGTELDRKFKIERVVAEGGFGVVYAGRHIGLDAPIAIKVLKTPGDLNEAARKEFIAKFVFEAKTIARIKHPNIVQVLDTGVSDVPVGPPAPWMVLEWLTGQSLEESLHARRGQGGRPPAEVFALLRPVLEALAYAHDEGVAHRDIKPGNVMLVPMKRGVSVRLLDFGIAKLMNAEEKPGGGFTATRSSLNAFSPHYAAPEQIGGARTGPWTDVHAMGLLFTELLTDRAPYGVEELTELFQQVLSPIRPSPRKHGIDVGPLEAILQRAVAFKPEERFKDAHELLLAIEQAIPQPGVAFGGSLTNPGVQFTQSGYSVNENGVPVVRVPTENYALTGGGPQTGTAPNAFAPSPTTLRSSVRSVDIDPSSYPPGFQRAGTRNRGVLVGAIAAISAIALGGLLFVGLTRASQARHDHAANTQATMLPSTSLAMPVTALPSPTVVPAIEPAQPEVNPSAPAAESGAQRTTVRAPAANEHPAGSSRGHARATHGHGSTRRGHSGANPNTYTLE